MNRRVDFYTVSSRTSNVLHYIYKDCESLNDQAKRRYREGSRAKVLGIAIVQARA